MRVSGAIAALCVAAANAQAQALPAGFGWFADLAGACWVGRFADGATEHTQCYTMQYGRFLRGTAALATRKDGALQLAFEGDSVFAWDEASKRIVYFIWGSDGGHRQLEARFAGSELHFPVPSRTDPAAVAYRSVWRRVDADTFEVRRERPRGDAWATELTATYRKAAPASAPSTKP